MSQFLAVFEHKVRESSRLNRPEVYAITAFLCGRVKEFAIFETAQAQLRQLVRCSTVLDVDLESSSDDGSVSQESVDLAAQVTEVRSTSHHGVLHWGVLLCLEAE
jgi:hypothetical protein